MKLSIQKALLPDAMPIARLLDEVTVQLHQKGFCSGSTLGIRIKSDRTSCWNGCGHAGTAKSWSALFRCGRCRPPYGWTAGQSLTANGICIGWLCAPPARAAAWAQSSSVLPAVWQTMRKRIFIWIAGREITLCAASILRQILIQLVYFRKKITKYASFPAISAKKGSRKKGSFCPKYLPFGSRLAALAFPLHISTPIPVICAFCNRKASFVSCVRLIIFTPYLPFAFDGIRFLPFFIWTDGQ